MLLQLNGLVTLGPISPTKANVFQRDQRTILDVLQKRTRTGQHELAPEALAYSPGLLAGRGPRKTRRPERALPRAVRDPRK
jgi:hypothetical protein